MLTTTNDMERKAFVFYRSFYEATSTLDDATFGSFMRAIVEYGLNGTIPEELTPMAHMAFTLIKPQIDANNTRYENGCKGGAPKGSSNNPNGRRGTNQELTKNKPTSNQELTEKQPLVSSELTENKPKEKDKDKDKVKDKEYLSIAQGAERERDFSIKEIMLFVKHLTNFRQEAQFMSDYYESTGWLNRNGQAIKSVSAAARMWQPKGKTSEYDATLLGMFEQVYRIATPEQQRILLDNFANIRYETDVKGYTSIVVGYYDKVFDDTLHGIMVSRIDEWKKIWKGEVIRSRQYQRGKTA